MKHRNEVKIKCPYCGKKFYPQPDVLGNIYCIKCGKFIGNIVKSTMNQSEKQ